MKIQVVRCDGQTETLELVGTVRVKEPSPGGQGSLLIEATGTTHFFREEDGAYDGWGMEVVDLEGKLNQEDVLTLITTINQKREIHKREKGV